VILCGICRALLPSQGRIQGGVLGIKSPFSEIFFNLLEFFKKKKSQNPPLRKFLDTPLIAA